MRRLNQALRLILQRTVAYKNVFCLFKFPLNDAFLKGTVEINEFKLYCKLHKQFISTWSILISFFPFLFKDCTHVR